MRRIEALDLWRSACVFAMIAYHTVCDLALLGAVPEEAAGTLPALAARYFAAVGFILISGICARLSRGCARRGFTVLCAGLLVSAATAVIGLPVKFGILQLLGCSMLLYGAARERLDGLRGAAWLWAALLAAGARVCADVRVGVPFLYPLGLRTEGFYSADYYPLVPWLFLFLLGTRMGGYIIKNGDKPPLTAHFPPALTFAGRHSLVIYLLHQPLIYGACRLLLKK